MFIKPLDKKAIKGEYTVPGDKSISHRSIMLSSISEGQTKISGFLKSEDCIATIDCFKQMGVEINEKDDSIIVNSKGLHFLEKPSKRLYIGNSGTSIRLIAGILAGQTFNSSITGDSSIEKRPMARIVNPLKLMNAKISAVGNQFAPLDIEQSELKAIDYTLPVASAQVKSAVLLAGLYAKGNTIVREKTPSRNHTELMLSYLAADIESKNGIINLKEGAKLKAKDIQVPGDISSASYLIVAALISENSEILIKSVGMNKTRNAIIDVLIKMGANIKIENKKIANNEELADIYVKHSKLKGIEINGAIIPNLIDEIPILAVAAAFAEGETTISDAKELRVKESDRIKAVVSELSKMNVDIVEKEDGMIIKSGNQIKASTIESYGDHRIAMSLSILALMANDESKILNHECANVSFPGFYELINNF